MKILSLDVGEKNIGLAISDELGWIAHGLTTLRRREKAQDLLAIAQIARDNQVSEVVVGMPINLNGTLGQKAQEVAVFVEELKQQLSLPIKVWDERFSTKEAEKVMIQADVSRKKRKRKIDQLAAQLILQNYLDAQRAGADV